MAVVLVALSPTLTHASVKQHAGALVEAHHDFEKGIVG